MSRPFDQAQILRACLESALAVRPSPPAQTCMRTGTFALLDAGTSTNDCCEGLAWVRIQSIDPVQDPLAPETNPCSGGFSVTYEIGVARCQPFGDAQMGITCEQWDALALQIDDDAEAMRAATCCYAGQIADSEIDHEVRPGSWLPLETEGGCTGGSMTVTVFMNRWGA